MNFVISIIFGCYFNSGKNYGKTGGKLFIRSLQFYLQNYKLFTSPLKGTSSVIVMLDNKIMHGGLVDRLKGIVSGAMIAEELNLDFKILVDDNTFNLFEFLVPVKQQIVAKKSDVSFNYFSSKPILMYNLFKLNKENILRRFKNRKQFHLYNNMDVTNRFFPELNETQLHAKWRDTFLRLFKFDEYFHNYWKKNIGMFRVYGIHLRFMSLLGDFDEIVNNEMEKNDKEKLVTECIEGVIKIMQQHDGEKYVVVADSVYFLERLKLSVQGSDLTEKLFIPAGIIGHIDIVQYESVLQKAILDFYLLSRCLKVFQIKGNKMHNSQYCRYAALLGNVPYVVKQV